MALIKCKNGDLYRQWLDYFRRIQGKPLDDPLTASDRTQAYFASERCKQPPLFG
jgi:hypothetical protein